MNNTRLLPVGSSPLEVAAARACADIENTPVPLRRLWNADDCPANLLPWLAWAFSVDRWDESWPEATKRDVIRAARFIHEHKGTIGAVRRVVEPLGYYQLTIDGKEVIEIDVINMVMKVDGVDRLAEHRKAIGL